MKPSIILLLVSVFFFLNTAHAGFIGTFTPIPEPSTGILMILGIIAGVGLARHKHK